jgi:hypothetical protein
MTHSISYRRILNRMGYYSYQNGLIYRHYNQEGSWDNHLERCRRFILRTLDYYKPFTVTVLGSGWLLELPVAEMIERTEKIRLIDIVHPPEVITQAGKLKNVELIEQDVTGGLIQEVWNKTRKYSFLNKMKSLENINLPEYKPDYEPGLIISLNILTQLESLLIEFLKKRSKIKEEEFNLFRTEVQKKHISFLTKHSAILISDFTEIISDKSGNVKTVPTLVTDVPEGKFGEEWTWDFDLKGTDYYNSRSIMKVMAVTF